MIKIENRISFKSILILNSIMGVFCGLLSGVFYLFSHGLEDSFLKISIVFISAPIAQSVLLCIYTLIGYPAIKWLIKKNKILLID